ncbi:hypothetical protein Esti_001802 [Eimeria stiedai]
MPFKHTPCCPAAAGRAASKRERPDARNCCTLTAGERYFVLRLTPFGAAQLWDPLSGDALCLTADEQRQGQLQQQHDRHTQKLLQEAEELWKRQLDVLASLQRIDAELQSVRQRVAVLFPAAERLAASQHRNLHLASKKEVLEEEVTAAVNELQSLEQCIMELQGSRKCSASRVALASRGSNPPPPFSSGRSSSSEASARLLVAEDSPAEFVLLTASAGIPENKRHLRQTIRSRLQKRRRWRCFGIPALTRALRTVARVATTPRWWLRCYLKCIAFLCCDSRRLRPRANVSTLMSCLFALQNTREWSPFLAEPVEVEEGVQREAFAAYEEVLSPLNDKKSSGAAAESAAAKVAKILGVHSEAATRIFLLPPTGRVRPLLEKLSFSEPDESGAVEAGQQLQRSIQNLLVTHYYGRAVGCEVGVAGNNACGSRRKQLTFTGEPHAAVYDLLSYYEVARCTHAWHRPARLALSALGVDGALTARTGVGAVPTAAACCQTKEQALEDSLRLSVSNCFPGRPLRGMVLHFVELNADKLAARLVEARVFDCAKSKARAAGSSQRPNIDRYSVLFHTESAGQNLPLLVWPLHCRLANSAYHARVRKTSSKV